MAPAGRMQAAMPTTKMEMGRVARALLAASSCPRMAPVAKITTALAPARAWARVSRRMLLRCTESGSGWAVFCSAPSTIEALPLEGMVQDAAAGGKAGQSRRVHGSPSFTESQAFKQFGKGLASIAERGEGKLELPNGARLPRWRKEKTAPPQYRTAQYW